MKKLSLILLLTILAFTGAFFTMRMEYHRRGVSPDPVTLVIAKGTPTLQIGKQLQQAGVVHNAIVFAIAVHAYPGKALKAGEYNFPAHAGLAGIITQLRAGLVIVHRITIPEGLTNLEIKALLEAEPALGGAVGALPPEGTLMPSTYTFTRGDLRSALITRMHAGAEKMLHEAWAGRDKSIAILMEKDALILASIVEKETGIAAERPKVAAVFYNRLVKNIPLQSDPTIIYAMSDGKGTIPRPLGHHDLAFESPYNSYIHPGLPPTPICNPGRAAIEAVLHPDHDDYLYFVATGVGGHAFAATLEEHNRNVASYVRVVREKEQHH